MALVKKHPYSPNSTSGPSHDPRKTTTANEIHSSNQMDFDQPETPSERPHPQQAQSILAQQRLRRPVSPHLSIYKWQVHSVSSALERNTGILFAGGLYLYATSYLVAPYLGYDLSTTTVAAAVAGLPVAVKTAVKFALAWPFAFHVVNGVRHLATSGGHTLASKRQLVNIAWGVVGVSFVSAVGLVVYS